LSNSKSTTTPNQLWCGETPNISHLRIFGLVAFVHISKVNRQKLDPKSVKCLFVGNATIQTAYRCWSPTERKIKIRRNVIFDKQINCNPFSPSEPTNLFFFEKYILQPSADASQIEREIKKSDPDAQFEPSIQAELPTPDVQFESTDTPTSVTDVSTSTDNPKRLYNQWIRQHLIHQHWFNQLPKYLYASHHIHCGYAYLMESMGVHAFHRDRRAIRTA
jgi:hypothetical protein